MRLPVGAVEGLCLVGGRRTWVNHIDGVGRSEGQAGRRSPNRKKEHLRRVEPGLVFEPGLVTSTRSSRQGS
jgi:hypothetical protein